jgi:hypothetical protein
MNITVNIGEIYKSKTNTLPNCRILKVEFNEFDNRVMIRILTELLQIQYWFLVDFLIEFELI